jgi:hypothetical protein
MGGAVILTALCLSGRLSSIDLDGAAMSWGALGLLMLGGMWGAAYARAQRARADVRGAKGTLRLARRVRNITVLKAARWAVVILTVVWLASLGIRSTGT